MFNFTIIIIHAYKLNYQSQSTFKFIKYKFIIRVKTFMTLILWRPLSEKCTLKNEVEHTAFRFSKKIGFGQKITFFNVLNLT